MARLNEPPVAPSSSIAQPGVESVDALKRRFIRQNRDLAKNNSNQSLRIRSLENEVSRLLGDNLRLREENCQLQNERDEAKTRASAMAVAKVKDDLQAKIAELSGLIAGIELPKVESTRSDSDEPRRMEGTWIERQPLTEIMRDSQMPTIAEHKEYPRRTLEAGEIQTIRLSDHSSNESPDIGPPPIAHFNYEDPVKQMSPSQKQASPVTLEDVELPASLSVNLETRRKRKDGQSKLEIRRHSILAQSPTKTDAGESSILRTGAKRKLGDREPERAIKPPSKDDFTFSRRSISTEKASLPPSTSTEAAEVVAGSPSRVSRRVLGDKSVNMSPRKVSAASEKNGSLKPADSKGTVPRFNDSRAQQRARRTSAIPMPMPQEDLQPTIEVAPPPELEVADMPPQTPAALDLFSPTPSEPSTKPSDSRDTPPPSDLSAVSTLNEEGIRPSRRARSAVNYAEPNLVAKLRRPGKEMVDALSGLQDPRRAMSVSAERKTLRTVAVKAEPEDDDAWKSLPSVEAEPGSPMNGKVSKSGGTTVSLVASDECDTRVSSALGTGSSKLPPETLSSLLATSKRRQTSTTRPSSKDNSAKETESLDIYDFKDSSSPQDDGMTTFKPAPSAVRTHRRHSSLRTDTDASRGVRGGSDKLDILSLNTAGPGRLERAASRRRSMVL